VAVTQGALFPLQVRHHRPPIKGRDVRVDADVEDGMRWTLKRQAEQPHLPATEFLCHHLAQACALPTPHFGVLRDLDGTLVFGSRHEGGVVDLAALPPDQQPKELVRCQGRISACFALDLIVANEDRHFGNFIYRRRDDGLLVAMPIDWGRAWWVTGWPLRDVHLRSCITTLQIQLLRELDCWSATEALMAIGAISSIAPGRLEAWLDLMPPEWLGARMRDELLTWWGSDAFHQRLSACVTHCR
jgi:hypothetical protein